MTITKRGRELDGSHFRVVGGESGGTQVYANLVPTDDTETYTNQVDYSTENWASGDAKDWDRWINRDVKDQATIEELAAAIGDDVAEPLIEAKGTIEIDKYSVGDSVYVEKSEAGIDRDMRIFRIKTTTEGAATTYDVLLSTRATVRRGAGDDLEAISKTQLPWG